MFYYPFQDKDIPLFASAKEEKNSSSAADVTAP